MDDTDPRTNAQPPGDMRTFLRVLTQRWPPATWLEVRPLPPRRRGLPRDMFQLAHLGAAERLLSSCADFGQAAMVGVNPRHERILRSGGGGASNIAAVCAIVVDVDASTKRTNKRARRTTYDDCLAQLAELETRFGLRPTMLVRSGDSGVHGYFLLREPAAGPQQFARVRHIAGSLEAVLDSDPVADPARVLRVPGVQTYKNGVPRNPASIEGVDPSRVFALEDFAGPLCQRSCRIPWGCSRG